MSERGPERLIGRYDFEGGGHVRVLAASKIGTEEALDMVETLIGLKRQELERKRNAAIGPRIEPPPQEEERDAG